MGKDSKIEWCDHTANLVWGCTHVHEGCLNCYAETLSHRYNNDLWGNDKPRKRIKGFFKDLLKYQKLAAAAGEQHRVFVGSMMDIFEKPMPLINSEGEPDPMDNTGKLRDIFFQQITEGWYPNLLFLLLTKRPSNINKYIPESWKENPPANVMFGYSPVTQKTLEDGVTQLLEVKGRRFLSVEPQLEYIKLGTVPLEIFETDGAGKIRPIRSGIEWVIEGGESGHGKRPFDIEWARAMRDECKELGIAYFFKQIDKVQEIPEDLLVRQFPK